MRVGASSVAARCGSGARCEDGIAMRGRAWRQDGIGMRGGNRERVAERGVRSTGGTLQNKDATMSHSAFFKRSIKQKAISSRKGAVGTIYRIAIDPAFQFKCRFFIVGRHEARTSGDYKDARPQRQQKASLRTGLPPQLPSTRQAIEGQPPPPPPPERRPLAKNLHPGTISRSEWRPHRKPRRVSHHMQLHCNSQKRHQRDGPHETELNLTCADQVLPRE